MKSPEPQTAVSPLVGLVSVVYLAPMRAKQLSVDLPSLFVGLLGRQSQVATNRPRISCPPGHESILLAWWLLPFIIYSNIPHWVQLYSVKCASAYEIEWLYNKFIAFLMNLYIHNIISTHNHLEQDFKLAYRSYCHTLSSSLEMAFTGDCGSTVIIQKVGQCDCWIVGPCISVICGDSGTDVGQNESWDTSSVRQSFIETSCSPQCTICCACDAQREPSFYSHINFTHWGKNNYNRRNQKSIRLYTHCQKRHNIIWSQWRKIELMIYYSTTRNVRKQCSLCITIITRQGQAVAIWTNTHHQIFVYIIRTSGYQMTMYLAWILFWTWFPWHTHAWSCLCGYRTSRQVLVILYIPMLLVSVYEIIS